LVVADDDDSIREGLLDVVDWESLGFRVVADFADGEELIAYLKKYPVDVVLTDIRMSLVSGIDVAKFIDEEGIAAEVVFLSGYREFEYARKAVSYGVREYLLKPVELEEIYEVIGRVRAELDRGNAARTERQAISHAQREAVVRLFDAIREGRREDIPGLHDSLELLDSQIDRRSSPCVVFTIDVPGSLSESVSSSPWKPFLIGRTDNRSIYVGLGKAGASRDQIEADIEAFASGVQRDAALFSHKPPSVEIAATYDRLVEADGPQLRCVLQDLSPTTAQPRAGYRSTVVAQAKEFVESNYMKDISLQDVADAVCLSSVYFSRVFKEVEQVSFIKYLNTLRIDRALEMLRKTHLPSKQIASMVGYSSLSYFSKTFKKFTGRTPTEYRRGAHERG
jgi:two-component system response regulator YesN